MSTCNTQLFYERAQYVDLILPSENISHGEIPILVKCLVFHIIEIVALFFTEKKKTLNMADVNGKNPEEDVSHFFEIFFGMHCI